MDTLIETIFGSSSSPMETGTKRQKKRDINVDTSNMENIYDVQEYTKILTGRKKKVNHYHHSKNKTKQS